MVGSQGVGSERMIPSEGCLRLFHLQSGLLSLTLSCCVCLKTPLVSAVLESSLCLQGPVFSSTVTPTRLPKEEYCDS